MINSRQITFAVLVPVFCAALMLTAHAETWYGQKHPIEVSRGMCKDCHADKWRELNHSADWSFKHKFGSAKEVQICYICHRESYCADCHPNREELKPSDKYKQAPDRVLPHRGDYLTQHKIDGRINPVPCFRCHGRQNNTRCRACHR